ncbi:transcriptional regulator, LysR family [Arboricoccus pini]|uniref:Transcriptional regulator, LysR family n=1 Tax=Arboricoccus pini TaxID=1963835 RepID=A0A212RS78_9PROT|nr:LysR family transcriptional regulator [Arboricoccus pini]SNB75452.1 transcriptional regulator, LysR family [Arboricoccus pini]
MQRLPDFTAWAIFAKVAERSSFAGAASELGLSKGTVSKAVTRLEAHLGRPLFHRSTRRLALTETGREALAGAARILAAGQEAEATTSGKTMRGTIRLAVPMSFGIGHVAPLLPAFLREHPEIAIDLHLSDAQVDLIGEGYDMALRIAALSDSRLRARRLCQVRRHLVASPAYLARHGRPLHPRDLERHVCLSYANLPNPDRWRFTHLDGAEISIAPSGPLRANNAEALAVAVKEGLGLALQPEFLIWEDLLTGTLETVMPDWSPPGIALHVLTPPSSPRPPHVEALSTYLALHLGKSPWAIAG